jgi:uncharacterized protein YaaR (DUF327 family)
MSSLRKLQSNFYKAGGGDILLFIGQPGSGKTHKMQSVLNNFDKWVSLETLPKPRQLIVSSGGARSFPLSKRFYKQFEQLQEKTDILSEEKTLDNILKHYESSVIVIDDCIIADELPLRKLVSFLYRNLRHRHLLLLIALHSVIYIPTIQNLVKLATGIFLLPSLSNLSCIRRLSQWFVWQKAQERAVLEEFGNIVQNKNEHSVYDCFLILLQQSICIANIELYPIYEPKTSFSSLNRVYDLVSEMSTKYFYLVPEDQICDITSLCDEKTAQSDREKFINLFSKQVQQERVHSFLEQLEKLKVKIDYNNNSLTVNDTTSNLLDLCNIVVKKRSKISRQARHIFTILQRKGLVLPEVLG